MADGIRTRVSAYPFGETIVRAQNLMKEKGITLFCTIEHSREAEAVGLSMRKTTLLVFGSPAGGTPVMVAAPSAALDLPLKLLIAEDEAGQVLLSWNDPEWLRSRHSFSAGLATALEGAAKLAEALSRVPVGGPGMAPVDA